MSRKLPLEKVEAQLQEAAEGSPVDLDPQLVDDFLAAGITESMDTGSIDADVTASTSEYEVPDPLQVRGHAYCGQAKLLAALWLLITSNDSPAFDEGRLMAGSETWLGGLAIMLGTVHMWPHPFDQMLGLLTCDSVPMTRC